jgi:hypothetical protein
MSEVKTNKVSPVGANGTVTLGDSGDTITVPSGVTFANSGTATGFGKVLQIVSMTASSEVNTTGSTYLDTGLTLAITPTSTSSKVFIMAQCKTTGQLTSGTRGGKVGLQILRDSTIVYGPIATAIFLANSISAMLCQSQNWNQLQHLDSPSTTSAVTYKLQYNARDSQAWANADGETGILTLMEIAG